jgi:nucleoporin NDC1
MERVKSKGFEVVDGYLPTVPVWVVDVVGWWKEWWRTERLSKVVEGSLPRRELDIVVIEGQLPSPQDETVN